MKNLLFLIFLFISILHGENISQIFQDEGGVVLKIDGYGNSIYEAKSNALQELVFQLQTSVDTKFELTTKVHNGDVSSSNEDTNNQLSMSAKSFFRGIHYSKLIPLKEGYKISVILTKKALQKTTTALKEDIFRPLDTLSVKQQKISLEKITTLRSLYSYIMPSDILKKRVTQQENIINKYLNMARVKFITNRANAKIRIDGRVYAQKEEFFLDKGKHHYTITADGYHDENGIVYLQAGISKTFYKNFIKLNTTPLQVYIDSDKKYNIKSQIISILSKYSINITKNTYATNALHYKFDKELIDTFGSTKFYRFSLNIDAYKGKEIFMSKKATIKRVAQSRLIQKSSKLTKVLTKALLQKLNIENFKQNSKVEYNYIFK